MKKLFYTLSIAAVLSISILIVIISTNQNTREEVEVVYAETASDTFQHLSILENTADGYKFQYPFGWKVMYLHSGLNLIPENSKGRIIINTNNDIPNIYTETEGLSYDEELVIIQAKEIVESSFEKTRKEKFDSDLIKERFRDVIED